MAVATANVFLRGIAKRVGERHNETYATWYGPNGKV